MQFTIIRPGGLKTQPATGRGVLTEDNTVCGAIHREDVADLLVHALFSDKTNNKVSSFLFVHKFCSVLCACAIESVNAANSGITTCNCFHSWLHQVLCTHYHCSNNEQFALPHQFWWA